MNAELLYAACVVACLALVSATVSAATAATEQGGPASPRFTLVLDGSAVDPTDIIVIGIDQVQRVGSDTWWHTDLRPLAEAAVPIKKQ